MMIQQELLLVAVEAITIATVIAEGPTQEMTIITTVIMAITGIKTRQAGGTASIATKDLIITVRQANDLETTNMALAAAIKAPRTTVEISTAFWLEICCHKNTRAVLTRKTQLTYFL